MNTFLTSPSFFFVLAQRIAHTGTIESHELKQVMANLGEILTDDEIKEMIRKLDRDGDGQIDFEEFVGLMKMRAEERNERDPEEELRDAFNIFDADGSGFIDRNEVRLLMKKLAQDLTDEGEMWSCGVNAG